MSIQRQRPQTYNIKDNTLDVFTDASFDSDFKVGSYGIVIIQPNKIEKYSGVFKNSDCPLESEMQGILNALHFLTFSIKQYDSIKEVNIYCDCEQAIYHLQPNATKYKNKPSKRFLKYRHYYQSFVRENGNRKFNLIHIKGHSKDKSDVKGVLNNWCDLIARLQLNTYLCNLRFPNIKISKHEQEKK